jgi:hypothetical protein
MGSPTETFKQTSLVDGGNGVDANSDNALSVSRCVNGVCHGILNQHKAVERAVEISVVNRFAPGTAAQSISASDCPCKSMLSPCKPWSLISPPIALRLSSRISDIKPRFSARNSDDIIIDC